MSVYNTKYLRKGSNANTFNVDPLAVSGGGSGGGGSLPTATTFGEYPYYNGTSYAVNASAVILGPNSGQYSQGANSVAIGISAGNTLQGDLGVAIGYLAGASQQGLGGIGIGSVAGQMSQYEKAVAIGVGAGMKLQGTYSVAIGYLAGQTSQLSQSVAIGYNAGLGNQAQNCVAIGVNAGQSSQGAYSTAVGDSAGISNQGQYAVALGRNAGYASQGQSSIAIGDSAGIFVQDINCIAIGNSAGNQSQGNSSIAIGVGAGRLTQAVSSIAIGKNAANNGQGPYSIAIGANSAYDLQGGGSISIGSYPIIPVTQQTANSICINATGDGKYLNANASSCCIAPLRTTSSTGGATISAVLYNNTTGELVYNPNAFGGASTYKTFVIDHPQYQEKYLVHACLEGPEAGVYYRGESQITNENNVEVKLPEYTNVFQEFNVVANAIIEDDDIPNFKGVSRVKDGKFKIYGTNGAYSWVVFAKRATFDVEPKKSDVNVQGNGPYKFIV